MVREAIEEELRLVSENTGKNYSTDFWMGNATIWEDDRVIGRINGKPEMTEDESFLYILTGYLKGHLWDKYFIDKEDAKNI